MTTDQLNEFAKQERFKSVFTHVHALRWKRTHDNRLLCLAAQPFTKHYQLIEIRCFNGNKHIRIMKSTPDFNEVVMTFNKEQGSPPLD